jgi:hypothetical protein
MAAGQPAIAERYPGPIMLPGFDEFLISYRDRRPSLAAEHEAIWSNGNGVFSPTIVRAGQVVGFWKRTFKKGAVVISLEPFSPLSASDHAAVAAAARGFGEFLGMPAELT